MNRCVVALVASAALAQDPAAPWIEAMGLTDADRARLEQGAVIGRLWRSPDPRDLGVVTAAKLRVPKQRFLDWYRNVENFKLSPLITEAGRFHDPASVDDLASLSIDVREVAKLEQCRPGKCGLKVTESELEQYRAQQQAGPDSRARALILDFARAYQSKGNTAMAVYLDGPAPVNSAEVFLELLNGFSNLRGLAPEWMEQLSRFQGGGSSDDQFLYWTREKYGFGLKPVVNVLHVSMYHPNEAVTVMCSKQVRASHYYNGSLGFTVLIDVPGGSYLLFANRSRVDLLDKGGWRKRLVERQIPGSARREISRLRVLVER